MFDMFKMLGKMGEVQEKLAAVKERLANVKLEESELDGVVTVEIMANKKVTAIRLSPDFYEKYGAEEREDILAEAVNNAIEKADAYSKAEMKKEMQGVIPDIPGLDLGSLGLGF